MYYLNDEFGDIWWIKYHQNAANAHVIGGPRINNGFIMDNIELLQWWAVYSKLNSIRNLNHMHTTNNLARAVVAAEMNSIKWVKNMRESDLAKSRLTETRGNSNSIVCLCWINTLKCRCRSVSFIPNSYTNLYTNLIWKSRNRFIAIRVRASTKQLRYSLLTD